MILIMYTLTHNGSKIVQIMNNNSELGVDNSKYKFRINLTSKKRTKMDRRMAMNQKSKVLLVEEDNSLRSSHWGCF